MPFLEKRTRQVAHRWVRDKPDIINSQLGREKLRANPSPLASENYNFACTTTKNGVTQNRSSGGNIDSRKRETNGGWKITDNR